MEVPLDLIKQICLTVDKDLSEKISGNMFFRYTKYLFKDPKDVTLGDLLGVDCRGISPIFPFAVREKSQKAVNNLIDSFYSVYQKRVTKTALRKFIKSYLDTLMSILLEYGTVYLGNLGFLELIYTYRKPAFYVKHNKVLPRREGVRIDFIPYPTLLIAANNLRALRAAKSKYRTLNVYKSMDINKEEIQLWLMQKGLW